MDLSQQQSPNLADLEREDKMMHMAKACNNKQATQESPFIPS